MPAIDRHDVALGWRLLGVILGAPLLVAMLAGGPLGHLVDPMSKDESSAFLLVRPISSLSTIRAKFAMAALITAAVWLLFLGYGSMLLARPGFTESIARAASGAPTWKAVGYRRIGDLAAVAMDVEVHG